MQQVSKRYSNEWFRARCKKLGIIGTESMKRKDLMKCISNLAKQGIRLREVTPEGKKRIYDGNKIYQEKYGNAFKGKKHKPETIQINREKHIGATYYLKGEKNHLWKGGITPKRVMIRMSIEYKNWRKSVFERDKFKCNMPKCENDEHYVEAHHIFKLSNYPDKIYDIDNGITLCRKCHNLTKWKEEKYQQLFLEILKLKIDHDTTNK